MIRHAEGRPRQASERRLEAGKGDDRQEVDEHQSAHAGRRQHRGHTAEPRPWPLGNPSGWTRLAKHGGRDHQGHQRQRRRDRPHAPGLLAENRQAEIGNQRAQREAAPERDADERHAAGPILRRRAVGDHGCRRAHARPGDAGTDPRQQHQAEGQRGLFPRGRGIGRHQDRDGVDGIEDDRSCQAQQQHRPTADPVGEAAPDRTEEKLHQRETREEHPDDRPLGGRREPESVEEGLGLPRHHGQDDPEPEQVDEDREEHDEQRGSGGRLIGA